jgi:hypothetical protein
LSPLPDLRPGLLPSPFSLEEANSPLAALVLLSRGNREKAFSSPEDLSFISSRDKMKRSLIILRVSFELSFDSLGKISTNEALINGLLSFLITVMNRVRDDASYRREADGLNAFVFISRLASRAR